MRARDEPVADGQSPAEALTLALTATCDAFEVTGWVEARREAVSRLLRERAKYLFFYMELSSKAPSSGYFQMETPSSPLPILLAHCAPIALFQLRQLSPRQRLMVKNVQLYANIEKGTLLRKFFK